MATGGSMNVSMLLTLVDKASPGVRTFTALLSTLEGVVNSVNARLGSFEALMARSGTTAVRVTQQFTGTGAAASQMAGNVAALGATVQNVNVILGTLATTLAGVAGAIGAVNAAGRQNNLGQGLQNANQHANGLMTTLRGVAQLWGAMEIKKGLVGSATDAIQYQTTQTRLVNLNLSDQERGDLTGAANKMSANVPQFNQNEALELGIDLRNATGSVSHAIEMMEPFARAIYDMKLALPHDKQWSTQDTQMVAKILEQRGATLDPGRMAEELSMITKIVTATQGRVDPSQLLGNLQYARGGLGANFDISFLPIMAAMIERIKSAGGQGGQIGTGLTTLQNVVFGTGSAAEQKERARLGLIDQPTWNKQGQVNKQKSDLKMAGFEQFLKNPDEWVQQVIVPALERAGINIHDQNAVNVELGKLIQNRMGRDIVSTLVNQRALLGKDAENISQTKGSEEQYKENIKTARAQIDAFKAQLDNLGIVIGNTLLPMITSIAKSFAESFKEMADFLKENPMIATVLTYAAAIVSLVLAFTGLTAVMGIAGAGTRIIFGALTAGVPMFAGLSGAVTAFGSVLSLIITRAIPVIGTFFLAWEFGKLIGDFDVFGVSLRGLMTDLIEWLVDTWAQAGREVRSIIKNIYGDGSKANAAPTGQYDANGNYLGEYAPLGDGNANYGNESRHGPMGEGPRGFKPSENYGSRVSNIKLFKPSEPPGGTGTGGRFKNYDEILDNAKNAFRLEEAEMKRHLRTMDEEYRFGQMSINDYYKEKLQTTSESILREIALLEIEKAQYKKQGDKAGVHRVETDIALKRNQMGEELERNEAEKKAALIKLDKDAINLEREYLTTSGQKHAAEALHVQQQIEAETKLLVLNGRMSQEQANQVNASAKARTEYTLQYSQIARIQEDYAEKIQLISDAEANGLLSDTAAHAEKMRLMKEEAVQLDELIAKLRVLAVASKNDKAVLELDKLSKKNKSVEGQLDPEAITMLKATQNGFTEMFSAVLNGSLNGAKALEKFAQSIKKTFLDMISKRLGDALFDSLFGGLMKASGGGGGGLFSFIAGMFGGGSANAAGGANSAGFGSGAGFGNQDLGKSFAIGTDYVPYDMIAQIHKGERIMTASENSSFSSATGGMQRGGSGGVPPVMLQIHPDAFHMKLGDWFEGEMSRQMATR